MLHRLRTLSTVVVASLAIAGIAAASAKCPPCHPDLPGTRSLTVTGAVTNYRFAGPGTLAVSVQTKRCSGLAHWNYAASAQAAAAVSVRGFKRSSFRLGEPEARRGTGRPHRARCARRRRCRQSGTGSLSSPARTAARSRRGR